jgi:nitrogen regulatory protein PII 2
MKEIIAIIRPKMVNATKEKLADLGYPSMTAVPVLGRGKQRGIANEVDVEIRPQLLEQRQAEAVNYIPKRQITMVVQDEDVEEIAATIIKLNQTGQFGDGKIFVCPLDNAIRIRTGEAGEQALLFS